MRALISVYLCLAIAFSTFPQSDCKPYLPISKGSKWEITNYSPKGKANGKTYSELIELVNSGDETIFSIKTISYDKKGTEVFANTYQAKCKNGKFEIDMSMKMDANAFKAYEDMDMQVDATDFELPDLNEAPGTILKDGSMTVIVGGSASPMGLNMKVLITDRKVEGKKQITTTAGTFECIGLSQRVTTKMVVNVQSSSKEWYAENVGLVRSETYNKSGKLMGYSELTMLQVQ